MIRRLLPLLVVMAIGCGDEEPVLSNTGTDTSDAADSGVDVAEDVTDVEEDSSDADSSDADSSDADSSDADSSDADDDVRPDIPPQPISLTACAGPGQVFAIRDGSAEPIDWTSGDLVVRGSFSECSDGVAAVELTLTSDCGGPFDLTFSNKGTSGSISLTVAGSDEVDGGMVFEGEATPGSPVTTSLPLAMWLDGDESGDFDLTFAIACTGDEATAWSLVLDTPSEAPTPQGANGWGPNLLPDGYEGEGLEVGDQLPNIEGMFDQSGNRDVALGDFYGEMLLFEFGGMWCAPCQLAAEEVAAVQYNAEQAGVDYGVRVLSLLATDYGFGPTSSRELFDWAERFGLSNPVLGGPEVEDYGRRHNIISVPLVLVVDPMLQVRARIEGFDPDADLVETIGSAWREFRAENPGWVSPRCRGVIDEGIVCGCVDDRTAPDDDGDGLLDACDPCVGVDSAGESPEVCPIGTEHPPIDGPVDPGLAEINLVRINFSAGYDSLRGILPASVVELFGSEFLPSIYVELVADGRSVCGISRAALDELLVSEAVGTAARELFTFTLTAENSEVTTNCDGLLDPLGWGADIAVAVDAVDWSISVVESCAADECPFSDAALWQDVDGVGWNATDECDIFSEFCVSPAVGAVLSTSTVGPLEGEGGSPLGIAYALPTEEDMYYVGDGTDWLTAAEAIAGFGHAVLFGAIGFDATTTSVVGTLLAAP